MTMTRNTSRLVLNYFNRSLSNSLNFSGKHNQQNSSSKSFNITKRLNTTICWKCGMERNSSSQIFCEKCHVVQAPSEKENYFKVLDIDEKFTVDQQDLRNKFRKMQSMLHPDKFSNKSDEEQNISAEYSSLLNKAYNNLQVPLKRAEHLLNLKGEQINEQQGVDDPEFLMEVMELNEEVENASRDKEALRVLNNKNKVELERISKEIDQCFKRNDIQAAKLNIIKLKYFNSVSKRINGILREMGEVD